MEENIIYGESSTNNYEKWMRKKLRNMKFNNENYI